MRQAFMWSELVDVNCALDSVAAQNAREEPLVSTLRYFENSWSTCQADMPCVVTMRMPDLAEC